ncbi:hypothetical protein L1987_28783 [Smallanthus sonchifolius]|uniref:Uncharacterized protein n=1 Tax=Smallanthus sonchifolius TaxID=185202 RepID=A0ACB9HY75_9ASTR|nr:hypothetical protein L1987_28783 [Smallanthus sonchifolius]
MSLVVHKPGPNQTESCQICANPIKGLAYQCKICNFWVHPLCVSSNVGHNQGRTAPSGSAPTAHRIGEQIAVGLVTNTIYDQIKGYSNASGSDEVPSTSVDASVSSNALGSDEVPSTSVDVGNSWSPRRTTAKVDASGVEEDVFHRLKRPGEAKRSGFPSLSSRSSLQMEAGGEEVIHDPDLSPVDSLEETIIDPHSEQPPQESDELPPPSPATGTPTLTDELREKIIKQVEYYLSDENLRTDKFLLKCLAKDEEGYIPVAIIATFKKMKKLTHHKLLIVAALKESSLLTLSSNEKKVKRIHPFPLTEASISYLAVLDPELCTVLVENLPEDHTIENMKKIFCHAGIIKKITVHEENATKDTRKCSIEEKLLSGKLYAAVEYETVEAAEKAVATLNNEHDWRHGMRVKLLKRRVKNTQKKKGHDSEKKNNAHVDSPGDKENYQSSEHHDDTPDEEHASHNGEHQSKDKNGNRRPSRRSRIHKHHQGPTGMGHGTTIHNHGAEVSKPPPGPRMPDGTRGFTMGRGRALS